MHSMDSRPTEYFAFLPLPPVVLFRLWLAEAGYKNKVLCGCGECRAAAAQPSPASLLLLLLRTYLYKTRMGGYTAGVVMVFTRERRRANEMGLEMKPKRKWFTPDASLHGFGSRPTSGRRAMTVCLSSPSGAHMEHIRYVD